MARLVVIYGTPKDPAAFDRYYFETHVPIAKKIPGLRNYEVSDGPIATPAGPAPHHLVAILTFDDLPSIAKALASPEAQATAADVRGFATGGVEMFLFDSREI